MKSKYRIPELAALKTVLGLCCLLSLAQPGSTQTTTSARQDTVGSEEKAASTNDKDNVKIFLDKIEILGRIEKPQTVFIIPGKDATISDIQIDRSFFREIFRSVEKDDFRKRNENLKQK